MNKVSSTYYNRNLTRIHMKLILLIFISVVFLVLTRYLPSQSWVQKSITTVAVPIQYTAQFPGQFWQMIKTNLSARQTLISNNQKLQLALVNATVAAQQVTSLQQENAQLKALLGFVKSVPGKPVPVTVLTRLGAPYVNRLIVLQNATHPVQPPAMALSSKGVVGQVVSANARSLQVLPIVAINSAIPVENTKTGVSAIARGDGQNGLVLLHVLKSQTVAVGEVFTTSGLGGRFAKGYQVATVTSVKRIPGQAFLSIRLKPLVNVAHSRYLVLLSQEATHAG